jgi:glycosyltransferase involved in cell wall biosynthesis
MAPRFSVIVPTRNRRTSLERCLGSLARQTVPRADFEVIVVDDGSDDDTVEWLAATTLPIELVTVRVDHGGPGAARNAGAARAAGDYLAFTEDDVVIAADWLERAGEHLHRAEVDILEGETRLEGTDRSTRRAEPVPVPSFIPCNLFVRRTVFERVGGYDTAYFDSRTGLYFREDADFGFEALEQGASHEIDRAVVVEHPAQFTSVGACLRHARRYVFDPLLYRRHRTLYRKLIEVKRFGPIRFHRPLHLASVLSGLGWALLVAGAIWSSLLAVVIGLVVVVAASVAVRAKYQGRGAVRIWRVNETLAFVALPLIYLASLIRGCVRARGGLGVLV